MPCCQPKVDHRLRSEFGPGVFTLRVRGPEYHALRFAYTPSTCTYTARFEVSLRGQYCLDTTLVYANYDAVVEVGYALQRWWWLQCQHLTVALWFSKRYPEPIQAFVFSDVTVALEGSSPPADPPPCTTMSPGRSCATLLPGCSPCSAADLMCTREVGTKSGYYGRGLDSSP